MKQARSPRCRAALLAAAVCLAASAAAARDTAGPEPRRAPDLKPKNLAPSATSAPPAAPTTAAPAPAAAPRPLAAAAPAPRAALAPTLEPEAPASPDAERAKQLYALGAEAFAAQRNADAIRYFQRAAAIVPSPKLTYNVGLAYEEMGDAGRALAEYRTYLEQEAASDPARRDEVLARIAHLEQSLAETGVQQLRVTSEPPGATVRIAGRVLGVTPWSGELAPGAHVVELQMPGHTPQHTSVIVPADHGAQLSLALAPAPAPLAPPEPNRWANVSPLTWTFLGVGAASLAGGMLFEISRSSSSDAARRAGADAAAAAEARGAADAKQMASLLLFGFGAGFSIGGSVLLALELSRASDVPAHQTAFGSTCAPDFCGITAHGRF